MKKLLLIFVLLLPITSHAELLKLGEINYIDTNTIKERDGYFYFWTVQDFKKPNPSLEGALSSRTLYQGDCSEPRRVKILSASAYNSPMGQGNLEGSSSFNNPEWHYIPPQSIASNLMNFVCMEEQILTQKQLREHFSRNRVGKSPDYGVIKYGDEYLATFHGYSDDKAACESALRAYGAEFKCVPLNTTETKNVIEQGWLKAFFFKNRVGKSQDYGVIKNGDDYLATFHGYSDDGAACKGEIKYYGREFSCIKLND